MSLRAFLLVISPLLLFVAVACRDGRMSSRDLTSLTVVRHLPDSHPVDSTRLAGATMDTVPIVAAAPASLSPGDVRPSKRKFHVIAASCLDSLSAVARLRSFHVKGFPEACILHSNGRYRVSIAQYSTRQAAIDARARLVKTLDQPDLWIVRH